MFGEAPPFLSREDYIKKLHSMESDRHSYETVLSVGYALKALGESLNAPFRYVENIDICGYLSSLPWNTDAWDAGHNVDILATAMYFNRTEFGLKISENELFGWLNAHISPQTGMWGRGKDGCMTLPINGWYRVARGSYGQFGAPAPFAEMTIDTVLAHSGPAMPRSACYTLDTVYPLWLCSLQTKRRLTEGQAWAAERLREIIPAWKNGFGFELGGDVSLKGTEMWLSIIYNLCKYIGREELLGYRPRGVHFIDKYFC